MDKGMRARSTTPGRLTVKYPSPQMGLFSISLIGKQLTSPDFSPRQSTFLGRTQHIA